MDHFSALRYVARQKDAIPPLAVLIALVLAGCGVIEADKEENLPKVEPDAKDITPEPDIQEDAYVCEPEKCDGIIDKNRKNPTDPLQYLCISFDQLKNKAGLNTAAEHSGIVDVDINKDGKLDLYFLNNDSPNQLFVGGVGAFTKDSTVLGLDVGGDSRAAAFGDYDGDGDVDMLLCGDNGSALYTNKGGVFQQDPLLKDFDPGLAAVWIGSNALISTENGTRYYVYTGGSFVEDAVGYGLYDPGAGAAFAVADYDNNGLDDIYLANSTGKNRFFVNIGDGTFEAQEDELNVKGEYGNSTAAAWFNLKADDKLPSLYVANWDAANLLYVNDGKKFTNKAVDYDLQDPGFTTCAEWGDFLNEGNPGLFLCRAGQMNLLYVPRYGDDGTNQNITTYDNVAYPSKMALTDDTISAKWVDFNGDKMLDLVVAMANGAVQVYRNNTHWVKGCE